MKHSADNHSRHSYRAETQDPRVVRLVTSSEDNR